MLRVVVESAKGLPKKTLGVPDPITTVIFRGRSLFSVHVKQFGCVLVFSKK